jgi:hypothetical protein
MDYFLIMKTNLQSINELYETLKKSGVEKLGGRLDPSSGMPSIRYIFNKGNEKFNTLSITTIGKDEGYETILKKDDKCVFIEELGYDDVGYFETAEEVENEIIRLSNALDNENQPH